MRVEQEQRVTEDARRFSEQDAAAQRYAAQVLQVWLLFLHLVWFRFVVVGSYYIIHHPCKNYIVKICLQIEVPHISDIEYASSFCSTTLLVEERLYQ